MGARERTPSTINIARFWIALALVALCAILYIANQCVPEDKRLQSHADRLPARSTYVTQAGDTLDSVARSHKIPLVTLARDNPYAWLTITEAVSFRLYPARILSPTEAALVLADVPLLEGQRLRIPRRATVAPRQWIDWALWVLIGAASSSLSERAQRHRQILHGKEPPQTDLSWPRFCLDAGAAFAVLVLLSLIGARLVGQQDDAVLGLNTDPSVPNLMLTLAFLLGFYRRVARQAFANAAAAIRALILRAALGDIEIIGPLGNTEKRFETRPKVKARWAPIHWTATAGTITDEGVYKPPTSRAAKRTTITVIVGRVRATFPHYLGTVVTSKVVPMDDLV